MSAPAIARVAPRDPAAGRAVPRPVGRGHPQAHVPDHRRRTAASCACGPTSPSRCRATISPRPRPARPQGFCYLGPVFRDRGDAAGRIPAGRHRVVRPRRQGRGRRRDAGARPRSHRALRRRDSPDIRMGDVGAVRRAGRRARSGAGLEAPAGEGLQPQDLARARSRRADARRAPATQPEYQGVLAALAGSDPKAAHALVTDLLSIAGITAVGGRIGRRDRRPLPRAGGARRRDRACRARRVR